MVDPWGLCPKPPIAPPGVNVNDNINIAKDYSWLNPGASYAFYTLVQNKGAWDYKQQNTSSTSYENFGNFNFGATGAAMGFPDQVLQRGAGWAQTRAGTSKSDWGSPLGKFPHGHDKNDQEQIKSGIEYTKCGCNK